MPLICSCISEDQFTLAASEACPSHACRNGHCAKIEYANSESKLNEGAK
jgi:hypothetical protein